MLRERDIEKYLVQRVKALGGEVRKVKWIGRRGAPDRLAMLPMASPKPYLVSLPKTIWVELKPPGVKPEDYMVSLPKTVWVELKATGVKPEAYQLREHERMRKMGQRVVVIDSLEGVDELLESMT